MKTQFVGSSKTTDDLVRSHDLFPHEGLVGLSWATPLSVVVLSTYSMTVGVVVSDSEDVQYSMVKSG